MGDHCCLMHAPDRRRDRTLRDKPCAPWPQDPASLTAPTIVVWSAYGRLLFAALPLETAQHWVAQGEAAVEAPHTIRCYPKEEHHA